MALRGVKEAFEDNVTSEKSAKSNAQFLQTISLPFLSLPSILIY